MCAARSLSFTAFADSRRVVTGDLSAVAEALKPLHAGAERLLVFDDSTGAPVDAPPPPEQAGALSAWLSALQAGAPPASAQAAEGGEVAESGAAARRPGVGRPRLGVVSREVTLLPRHWAWLSAQPGGASAALRRLVDEARQQHAARDVRRLARERAYRFMSGIASHLPRFEEASRALFAGDARAFDTHIDAWPPDVRAHLRWLARDAFDMA
ncbi:DUF2239 family protein [Ottowia testudinis]|uniref:DUF2239 family protein n=1 Tax=Ottowia testudinis TaxID=2816950 RepID=A0A975H4F3_9BURK|nr:DUF2239 family protein [Ottowia testudinis]QTD46261.1 DUF2239 family protein [Ottowia testudinis]